MIKLQSYFVIIRHHLSFRDCAVCPFLSYYIIDLLVIAKDAEDERSQMYSSGLNNYGQCGLHKENVPKENLNKDGNILKLTKVRAIIIHVMIMYHAENVAHFLKCHRD